MAIELKGYASASKAEDLSMNNRDDSRSIRVGLIGTGMVSHFHVRALKSLPNIRVAAVCDRNHTRAIAVQQAYGIPKVFDSVSAMAEGETLDAVNVSVPPPLHAATAIECLKHGWHVFMEKPLALTVEDCHAIEVAARQAGRSVGVNHNLTFMPAYLRLIEDVQARKLGRIEHVYVCSNVALRQWVAGQRDYWYLAKPQNIVLELGPHPLSMIVRLLGPVEAACALMADERVLKNGSRFFDTWQIALKCERGTAQWHFGIGREFPNEWMCVEGQDGCATVDLLRNFYTLSNRTRWLKPIDDAVMAWRRSQSYLAGGINNMCKYIWMTLEGQCGPDMFGISMRDSIGAFYKAIAGNLEPPVGLAEGAAVIGACKAIFKAAGIEGAHGG